MELIIFSVCRWPYLLIQSTLRVLPHLIITAVLINLRGCSEVCSMNLVL